MKSVLKVSLAALTLAFAVSSHAADKKLVVATDTAFVPFEFKQGDKYVGFDVDLWAAVAKELGMTYVHVPLGGPDTPYTPAAVEKVAAAIKAADGKVLLHCTVAWRASHMWAAYLVREKGVSYEDAVKAGEAMNINGYKPPNATSTPVEDLLGPTLASN